MPLEYTTMEKLVQDNLYHKISSSTVTADYYNIFSSYTIQNYFKYYSSHSPYFP